jgi:protein-S-isoprenylcysteine O-methyltransferase Ste14
VGVRSKMTRLLEKGLLLLRHYGKAYREYMKRVRMYIPLRRIRLDE